MTRPQPPLPKRKNHPIRQALINGWGCLLGAIMLSLGLALGVAGSFLIAPQLFAFDATETALDVRAADLAATQGALGQRAAQLAQEATDSAFFLAATRIGLGNERAVLDQTATQSAVNVAATRTAQTALDRQQRTQIALDATATQAQLQGNATRVEIDFRNTQAALDAGAGASAQSLAATATQTPRPPATATPLPPTQAILLPPSDTPAALNPTTGFSDNFATGIADIRWDVPDESRWAVVAGGIQAETETATLLTQASYPLAYRLSLNWAAGTDGTARYTVILHQSDTQQLTLHLDRESIIGRGVVVEHRSGDETRPIVETSLAVSMLGDAQLVIVVANQVLEATLGDTLILETTIPVMQPGAGRVGVQLPQGTTLQRAQLAPET